MTEMRELAFTRAEWRMAVTACVLLLLLALGLGFVAGVEWQRARPDAPVRAVPGRTMRDRPAPFLALT